MANIKESIYSRVESTLSAFAKSIGDSEVRNEAWIKAKDVAAAISFTATTGRAFSAPGLLPTSLSLSESENIKRSVYLELESSAETYVHELTKSGLSVDSAWNEIEQIGVLIGFEALIGRLIHQPMPVQFKDALNTTEVSSLIDQKIANSPANIDAVARGNASANATDIVSLNVSQANQDALIAASATKTQITTLEAQIAANVDNSIISIVPNGDGSITVKWEAGADTLIPAPPASGDLTTKADKAALDALVTRTADVEALKADKTELHAHSNKALLDAISGHGDLSVADLVLTLSKPDGSTKSVTLKQEGFYWDNLAKKLTITKIDGSTVIADVGSPNVLSTTTPPSYDNATKKITFTWTDNSASELDVTALFDDKYFVDIAGEQATKKLTFSIKDGSTKVVDLSAWFSEKVDKLDKATAANIAAGTVGKWVDAKQLKDNAATPETKDATPTAGSNNAVESQGIKTELDKKVDRVGDKASDTDIATGTVDKWVDAKQLKDKVPPVETKDAMPTASSTKAVESQGIKSEFDNVATAQVIQNTAITALQTSQGTQDTNITALQTSQGTQDTNITALQNGKVDKVTGKALSTNDLTDALKAAIEAGKLKDVVEDNTAHTLTFSYTDATADKVIDFTALVIDLTVDGVTVDASNQVFTFTTNDAGTATDFILDLSKFIHEDDLVTAYVANSTSDTTVLSQKVVTEELEKRNNLVPAAVDDVFTGTETALKSYSPKVLHDDILKIMGVDAGEPWKAGTDYKADEVFTVNIAQTTAVDKNGVAIKPDTPTVMAYDADTTSGASLTLAELAKMVQMKTEESIGDFKVINRDTVDVDTELLKVSNSKGILITSANNGTDITFGTGIQLYGVNAVSPYKIFLGESVFAYKLETGGAVIVALQSNPQSLSRVVTDPTPSLTARNLVEYIDPQADGDVFNLPYASNGTKIVTNLSDTNSLNVRYVVNFTGTTSKNRLIKPRETALVTFHTGVARVITIKEEPKPALRLPPVANEVELTALANPEEYTISKATGSGREYIFTKTPSAVEIADVDNLVDDGSTGRWIYQRPLVSGQRKAYFLESEWRGFIDFNNTNNNTHTINLASEDCDYIDLVFAEQGGSQRQFTERMSLHASPRRVLASPYDTWYAQIYYLSSTPTTTTFRFYEGNANFVFLEARAFKLVNTYDVMNISPADMAVSRVDLSDGDLLQYDLASNTLKPSTIRLPPKITYYSGDMLQGLTIDVDRAGEVSFLVSGSASSTTIGNYKIAFLLDGVEEASINFVFNILNAHTDIGTVGFTLPLTAGTHTIRAVATSPSLVDSNDQLRVIMTQYE